MSPFSLSLSHISLCPFGLSYLLLLAWVILLWSPVKHHFAQTDIPWKLHSKPLFSASLQCDAFLASHDIISISSLHFIHVIPYLISLSPTGVYKGANLIYLICHYLFNIELVLAVSRSLMNICWVKEKDCKWIAAANLEKCKIITYRGTMRLFGEKKNEEE